MNAKIEGLQGAWDIVALEVDGKTIAESGFPGPRFVVKGDTFTTVT